MSWKDLQSAAADSVIAAFAQDAVYNGGSTISVAFTREYTEVVPSEEPFATTSPVALVSDADVPTLAVGDTLAIDSVTYTIRNLEPQDDGTTLAILRV